MAMHSTEIVDGTTSFREREQASRCLIQEMTEGYWNTPEITGKGVHHVQYGYETHIPEEVRKTLINIDTPTARFVRFAPDYVLIRGTEQRRVILLEYKVTRMQRYVRVGNHDVHNTGQVEAAAWANYLTLSQNFEVALLIFCPYHRRPLLCGLVSEDWQISEPQTPKETQKGSGTKYVNLDLNQIPEFDEFMECVMGIEKKITVSLLNAEWFGRLRNIQVLQTQHHGRSPYKHEKTGFNWELRYISESDRNSLRRNSVTTHRRSTV